MTVRFDSADPRLDPEPRRAALAVRANPGERRDYTVTLSQPLPIFSGPARGLQVTVDYVPDRHVLDPDSLTRYLAGLDRWIWSGLEALGLAILDDLNNELVPRWLRVTVSASATGPLEGLDTGRPRRQTVTLEDRQPHWSPAVWPPGGLD
ncbi:hypothetical protein [Roseospira goensis]|uniref:NADPH-dependent 7-cyano-7-deazaguanine reductase QueF n=1 Tax=Roseospira goensis TaxID=391922 RepID=A0A7W6RXN7_9PROT|nr:hypothetical protein [Roseospira goensis]MBB4285128.1 NADPH-dependent 7-cyano-7-deazaguanine reductase QueF [Roseospira goensis]